MTGLLREGDTAPSFALLDANGDFHRLSDYRGKHVVLYFYPKDDTPGCTKEACDFRDHEKDFSKKKAVVIGISKDSRAAHGKFAKKYGLPFVLLSDPGKKTIASYGALKQKTMFGRSYEGVLRTTYLIDPKGKIKRVYPDVKVDGHAARVLSDL